MSSNNNFSVFGDRSAQIAFMKSAINSYNTVIEHYQFVLDDISSNISDPRLEAPKGPVVAFLKDMLAAWKACRDDVQHQLNNL